MSGARLPLSSAPPVIMNRPEALSLLSFFFSFLSSFLTTFDLIFFLSPLWFKKKVTRTLGWSTAVSRLFDLSLEAIRSLCIEPAWARWVHLHRKVERPACIVGGCAVVKNSRRRRVRYLATVLCVCCPSKQWVPPPFLVAGLWTSCISQGVASL